MLPDKFTNDFSVKEQVLMIIRIFPQMYDSNLGTLTGDITYTFTVYNKLSTMRVSHLEYHTTTIDCPILFHGYTFVHKQETTTKRNLSIVW